MTPKTKKLLIIGGAVLVVAVIIFFVVRAAKKKKEAAAATGDAGGIGAAAIAPGGVKEAATTKPAPGKVVSPKGAAALVNNEGQTVAITNPALPGITTPGPKTMPSVPPPTGPGAKVAGVKKFVVKKQRGTFGKKFQKKP